MIFRVLGPLEVSTSGGSPVEVGTPKRQTLLAVLVLHANEWVGVHRLMDILWDGPPPSSAVPNLHTYVSDVRRRLRPASPDGQRLQSRPGGYRLTAHRTELDLYVFADLVRDGLQALSQQHFAPAQAHLQAALNLWRGPPLDGLPVDQLQPELTRLNDQRYTALEDLIDAGLALGQHREHVTELQRLTTEQPLRERPWHQLILALYRSGRRADALITYRHVHRLLNTELGISPGPALQQLHQQILTDDPTLDPPIKHEWTTRDEPR